MRKMMTRTRASRAPLRIALAAAALAGAALTGSILAANPAAAAGYNSSFPYCVKSVDQIVDCTHVSWQECQFTAQGQGYCFANPYYGGRSFAYYVPHGRGFYH